MYKDTIGKFEFIFEKESNRIVVYVKGDTSPLTFLDVSGELTEKDFHYEIMDFVSKKTG